MLPVGMLHAPLVVSYLHNLVRVTILFISLDYFFSLCVCAVSFELGCEDISLFFFCNQDIQLFTSKKKDIQLLRCLLLKYGSSSVPATEVTASFTWSNVWASLFYSSFPEYLAMFMVRLLVLVLRQPSTCLFFNCFDIPLKQDQLFMFLCYARGLQYQR